MESYSSFRVMIQQLKPNCEYCVPFLTKDTAESFHTGPLSTDTGSTVTFLAFMHSDFRLLTSERSQRDRRVTVTITAPGRLITDLHMARGQAPITVFDGVSQRHFQKSSSMKRTRKWAEL